MLTEADFPSILVPAQADKFLRNMRFFIQGSERSWMLEWAPDGESLNFTGTPQVRPLTFWDVRIRRDNSCPGLTPVINKSSWAELNSKGQLPDVGRLGENSTALGASNKGGTVSHQEPVLPHSTPRPKGREHQCGHFFSPSTAVPSRRGFKSCSPVLTHSKGRLMCHPPPGSSGKEPGLQPPCSEGWSCREASW